MGIETHPAAAIFDFQDNLLCALYFLAVILWSVAHLTEKICHPRNT